MSGTERQAKEMARGVLMPQLPYPENRFWAMISYGLKAEVISCMLSPLVESFDKDQMATVNGMRRSSAWIASFLFTPLIGAVSNAVGFSPLFVAMGLFRSDRRLVPDRFDRRARH
jgi:hypothetical protein